MKCLANERKVGEMKGVEGGGGMGQKTEMTNYEKQLAPIFTEYNKEK